MYTEWLAMEQYRIQVMEQWPDGPGKESALAAARSALECLLREPPHPDPMKPPAYDLAA
jgi:hypothetical protein